VNADLEFGRLVADQLNDWAPVNARRMFGGVGLFRDRKMFGLVFDGVLYLKCCDDTAAAFDAVQAPPFRYQRHGKTVTLSYRQAPPETIDDADVLHQWANRAWRAALSKSPSTK